MSDLIVQGQTWNTMKEQATILVKSGFLPSSIKTPEQAMAIAIKGHEIGMPMMQAFSQIHVIQGKPTISAEGMNALIRKNCPGAKVEILVSDAKECKIRATRPGEASCEFSFTIEDAKRAGLLGNPTWSKYPDAMLFARCVSVVARRVFPDCLSGISYTPEELGAQVNEEGEVINVTPTAPPEGSNGAGDSKKNEEKKGFDKTNLNHINWIIGALEAKSVTDKDDIECVMLEMQGRPSSELDACLDEMYARAKPIVPEPCLEPLMPTGKPDVDEALAKINDKLGGKKKPSKVQSVIGLDSL